jgi:nicotinic acid mononucleotide adenylyltransferase
MIIGDDYGSCKPTPCFETKDDIWYIRMPRTEGLSSTKIRNAISRGEPLDDLASEPVRQYMLGRQAK